MEKVNSPPASGIIPCFAGNRFVTERGHNRMLVINGQSTQVPVIQVNGGDYVDIEALASTINGLVGFAGTQIALNMPFSSAAAGPTANAAEPASSSAPESNLVFSKGSLNAGIEQAATLREWHTALVSAIQNGYLGTAAALAPYTLKRLPTYV
jgi:hypothetical protein